MHARSSKNHLVVSVLILASLLVTACAQNEAPQNPPASSAGEIRMIPDAFSPVSLTVKSGEEVCWINDDEDARWPASDDHPTHTEYAGFDPGTPVKTGGTWCFTFERAGTWEYHDHLLPELMGAIQVTE